MAPRVDRADTIPIPQPRALPIVGNLWDVDRSTPLRSFIKLADQYGPIYSLNLLGQRRVLINNGALLSEVIDEKRFTKALTPALKQLRNCAHDGLFTSWSHEHNWEIAHRILVPPFGPLNLQSMFGQMKDIISQCILKWARYGPEHSIDVSEDWTRLTLDTLALTAMGYRFNSFYSNDMHPFVAAFNTTLGGAATRTSRPPMTSIFHKSEDAEFFKSIEYQRQLCADLIRERKSHPTEKRDLLTAMIEGKDPKTGESLTEQTIIDNMITFLVAGHETTSGMLSFATYCLLKNPNAYRRLREEIDEVVGSERLRLEHLKKLPYLNAVLRETLRLYPTAPIFNLQTKDPAGEVIGDGYFIAATDVISVNLSSIHRDPAMYGEDVLEFKPERMLDENMKDRPSYAWMPFGNGARACIGRHFAWQEALMALAMVLQYFDLEMDDPHYTLAIKQSLTQKPTGLHMRVKLRAGITASSLEQSMAGNTSAPKKEALTNGVPATEPKEKKSLTILYGSNCGTCEAFARTLATDASAHGYQASRVATLDSAKDDLPENEPVVLITASYEGRPCDNAKHFVEWLDTLNGEKKLNVSYAVFAAGHSDWKTTFHKVPKAIDEQLCTHGGKRICKIGTANAANGDMMSEFQTWEDETFWPALVGQSSNPVDTKTAPTENLRIEVSNQRASTLQAGVFEAKVVDARVLTAPGVPEKRHLEIKLPSDMSYSAGDYLAVLPLNPQQTVHRVLKRFGLPWDAMLTISSNVSTMLPTQHPISAHNLFSAYVELSQPATKRDISMLGEATQDECTKRELDNLTTHFAEEITKKRMSLLDLLDRFPSIDLPLTAFVGALVPMRVRQYSVSSSPLKDPTSVTLSYAVLDQVAMSGQGRYQGVASTFLSNLEVGDSLHVAVKPSSQSFHLPSNSESVPVIMVGAGTGMAPFRGFVQERAAQIGAGRKLAGAHLFIGSRSPDQDDLYRDEFDNWEEMGAVKVHRAFSRAPEKCGGYRHVQEVLLSEKTLLQDLWDANAKVFVCGSRQVGESVREASLVIFKDGCQRKGEEADDERANAWFDKIRNERYATDVFA